MRSLSLGRNKDKQVITLHKRGIDDSYQSILKEISPGCSLEGMMLQLKLQYFGHIMWRVDSLEKTLMLGGIGGRRRRGRTTEDWMAGWHHWLDERESEWTLGVGDGQGALACCNSWGCKESDTTEWLNWTELKEKKSKYISQVGEKLKFLLKCGYIPTGTKWNKLISCA